MEILGLNVSAPRLPSLGEIRGAVSQTVQATREFGNAALQRAENLGQQGVDLGRRAVADPDGTVRSLAAGARSGIHDMTEGARSGVHDAVMWSGRQIHAGADAARSAVHGNSAAASLTRAAIDGTERQARLTVGAAGGVVNFATSFVGDVGSLAVTGAELQYSPTARAELGQRVSGALNRGASSVSNYASEVAAQPSRVLTDTKHGIESAWQSGSKFVHGQIEEQRQAEARGEGPETFGLKASEFAANVVTTVDGARGVLSLTKGLVSAARGTEVLANSARLTTEGGAATSSLRAAGTETRVTALSASSTERAAADAAGARLVAGADAGGGSVRVPRSGGVTAQDLAAASRQTGREVALYRDMSTGERHVTLGTKTEVSIPQGSRLIAHTQPGVGAAAVRASVADEAALTQLGRGQRSSVIVDQGGTSATRFRPTKEGISAARADIGSVEVNAPKTRPAVVAGRDQVYVDVAGTKGAWNKELNGTLKANADYHYNGYSYATDAKGRVTSAEGQLDFKVADRNGYQQAKAGKSGGRTNDDGGHLFASIFNGPGERLNMVPMNGNLNKGVWKQLENKLADAASAGKKVDVKIDVRYDATGIRPNTFRVEYSIDGDVKVRTFKNEVGGK